MHRRGPSIRIEKKPHRSGNLTYGYKWEYGLIVEHPDEQRILRQIGDWIRSGHSYNGIAEMLNHQGSKRRSGRPWDKLDVYNIEHRQAQARVRLKARLPRRTDHL